MQADLVLERQLRVPHLGRQAAGRERERESLGLAWVSETLKPTPSDTPSPTRPHLPMSLANHSSMSLFLFKLPHRVINKIVKCECS